MSWKGFAIILLVILILENIFIGWGWFLIAEDERKMEECYYNVCDDYPDAFIDGNICTCYDYDSLGELYVAETEVIK